MLPKAVREAGEKADAVHSAAYGNTEKPAPEAAAAVPAPVVETPQAVAPTVDSWEHKYRVISNKYSAEVPRMAGEIRELKEKLREIADRQAPAPEAVSANGLTPEKVVEQYGEDFAAAVGALAAKVSEQHSARLREEFAPKVEAANSTAAANARKDFMRSLSKAVPDWEVIDQDEKFAAFLNEHDALSGHTRREFFEEADRANDSDRIINYFLAFREKSSVPRVQQEVARNAVEYHLSPSSSRATEIPAGKRVWTEGDIRRFYVDARKGLVTGVEYERIESDIFAAQSEGRLVAA